MNDAIAASPAKESSYDKWQAKSDMRTVLEANQIKKDPVRMKHVKRAAKEELADMKAMQDLAKG